MYQIPSFIRITWIDKNGNLTAEAEQYNDQLNQYLQKVIPASGFEIPPNTTQDINNFSNPSNPNAKPDGTIWYDSDINKYKGKENGVIVVFNTTPV